MSGSRWIDRSALGRLLAAVWFSVLLLWCGSALAQTQCSPPCAAPQVCVGDNVCGYRLVFDSIGALQGFSIPEGVTSVQVKMWGAGGGMGGGAGGYSEGTLTVVPGERLSIIVGGRGQVPTSWLGAPGGFGGGGDGGDGVANWWDAGGAGGGGRSEVTGMLGVITAGGGGGAGAGGVMGTVAAGGGLFGETGSQVEPCYGDSSGAGSGHGGGEGVGGDGGLECQTPWVTGFGMGMPGTAINGGNGGSDIGGAVRWWSMGPRGRGGGGGGGGFGGGGGGAASDSWSSGPGGGGGGRTTAGGITLAGLGAVPPNESDPERGNSGAPDNDGRVVITFAAGTASRPPAIQLDASYELVIMQGTQGELPITLTNVDANVHVATLSILSSQAVLGFDVSSEPVAVLPGELTSAVVTVDATEAEQAIYDDMLLRIDADDGTVLYSTLKVTVVDADALALPNLSISAADIQLGSIAADGSATMLVSVHNRGLGPVFDVPIRVLEFGSAVVASSIAALDAGESQTVFVPLPTLSGGDHVIEVVVDPENTVDEIEETDNEASKVLRIATSVPIEGGILLTGSVPASVCAGAVFAISGRAMYDIWVGDIRYTEYAVKGAAVTITVTDPSGESVAYGGVYSEVDGAFSKRLQAPAAVGVYRVNLVVTDKTFSARRQLAFRVVEPPPPAALPPYVPAPAAFGSGYYEPVSGAWVWVAPPPVSNPIPAPPSDIAVYSQGLFFSNDRPAESEDITIAAEVDYWASQVSMAAVDVPLNFYARYPGSEPQLIDRVLLSRITAGSPDFGARYAFVSWRNPGEGIYIIEVEVDPAYSDAYTLNNQATRAIIVGAVESQTGVISGHVTDIWGAVGDAVLQVFDSAGNEVGAAVSDEAGFYLIEGVPLDASEVRITAPIGFESEASAKAVQVEAEKLTVVDFFLTQHDNRPPTCNCQDVTVTTDGAGCSGTASIDAGAIDPDGNLQGCSASPAAPYALGDTSVTLTCVDTEGASCSCAGTVSVEDFNLPVVSCPADMVVQVSEATGEFDYGATVTDNCNGGAVSCAPSADALVLGGNHVACTAVDGSGNVSTCGFNAYLNASPVGACAPLSMAANSSCLATVDLASRVTDPDSDSFVCEQVPGPSELLSLGDHDIVLSCADDHGGNSTCAATVSVVDTTPPTISCPMNQIIECSGGQGTFGLEPSATDNCATASVSCDLSSDVALPLGTTINACTAVDQAGNEAGCGFTVQVRDTQPPSVTTPNAPIELWPPSHQLVDFELNDCISEIVDDCSGYLEPNLAGIITRITSDELEDDRLGDGGNGDGNTCNDAVLTGSASCQLRAERTGGGNGRVYRVYFDVADPAGNVTSGSCQALVPHDQSGEPSASENACAYCVGVGCGTCPTHDPSCTY